MRVQLRQLGIALAGAGDGAEADTAFQQASEMAPQDAWLHNNLAWWLATSAQARQVPAGRAVQLAQRAVELAPSERRMWHTLGVARYREGEWRAAVEALRKTIELNTAGDNAADWFFLAMARWQLGEREEARRWYGRAVDWMNENEHELAKDKIRHPELIRFRTEAAELLKIPEKKATTTTLPSQ
jgi:Flp pilus assembly protein TadD